MSRRTFLKGSAVHWQPSRWLPGGMGVNAFKATAASSEEVVWKNAFCAFCHFPACATKVKVVNGVAVEIIGDKNSETTRAGSACADERPQ